MAEEQLPPGLEPVTDPNLIATLEHTQDQIDKGDAGAAQAPYSQSALDAFDRAISTAQRLKTHPGFGAAVGSGFDPQSWGSFNPFTGQPLAGTNARNFTAELEAMKAQVFLPMVQSMKGMGALSNAEGEKLTAAIGSLDPGMGEDAFRASLDRIVGDLTTYRDRGDPAKKDANSATVAAAPAGQGDIGFNAPSTPGSPLTPEQQTAYDLFWKNNPRATADQLRAFGASIGVNIDNAEKIIAARDKGAGVQPGSAAVPGLTPQEQAEVNARVQGTDVVGAGVMGAADTVTMGTFDKLSAGADALRGSLQGEGAFTDLYGRRQAVNDAVVEGVQDEHPWAYGAGQVAGGVALPLFSARTPAQLAKVGASYGAAYGAGSSDNLAEVPNNVAIGAITGGGTAWAGGRLAQKLAERGAAKAAQAAGENAPPASETAAERYARAQQFGLEPGLDAVGGRGSKIVGQTLSNMPASASHMNNARKKLAGQVEEAVDQVAGTYGPTTSHPGIGEAAQRGAKSWISRFEDVSAKAYQSIPISSKAPANLTNTRQALSELTTIFESNPKMAETFKNTRLERYLDALSRKREGLLEKFHEEGNEHFFTYTAPDGKAADMQVILRPDGQAEISIDPFSKGANRFGVAAVRDAKEQILEALPQVKGFYGERLSGANPGRIQKVAAANKPEPGLSWDDMKAFRSRVGEEIGEQRFSDSPTKSEMRRLYGALSDDMRNTAAAQGPQALRAFERANNLYREGQARIEGALAKILGDDGKKSAEAAASRIQTIIKDGKATGDLNLIHEVWKSLPAAERGEVSNGLIRLMGQPSNSSGRNFSAETFIRNYSDMAPEAKNLLFGGENKVLRQNLDEFSKVIGDFAERDALRNTSNTAGQILTGAAFYGLGNIPGLMAQAATSYGSALLMTHPPFVKWATGYTKMLRGAAKAGKAPSAEGIKTQVRLLDKLAASDPALVQEIAGVRQAINDNFARAASASDDQEQR